MHQLSPNRRQRSHWAYGGVFGFLFLAISLLLAAQAHATYQQVDTFAGTPGELKTEAAPWPEEVQLGNLGGMAVNYTGAGGVSAGTVYAVVEGGGGIGIGAKVVRYNPDGSFSERWTWRGNPPEERCGPEGEAAQPSCPSNRGGGARAGADVDVDQSTGNVYVLGGIGVPNGTKLIHVYSPDGSEVIAEFGENASHASEPITASPAQIHIGRPGQIAVDSSGDVYVSDEGSVYGHRLMVFEPQSPGDYEHYVYAGQSHDVKIGGQAPFIDAAGHVYTSSDEGIEEYDPSQPNAPALCKFQFLKGGIEAVAVNPKSEELFFFTNKDKRIHQLGASCNEKGQFSEVGSFAPVPKRNNISAMAVDPDRRFDPSRPAGVLFAGAPAGAGGAEAEEGEPPHRVFESALGFVFAPPTALPPEVLSESVSAVGSASAKLSAQINPKGSATRYRFQYLTDAEYQANEASDRFAGAAEIPPGGALLGEGNQPLGAVSYLSGIEADTTYHLRAIATSNCDSQHPTEVCEDVGAELQFRTFPSGAPGLPDKRVYELVSPVDKEGGSVYPADPTIRSCTPECTVKPGIGGILHFPMQSAPGGDAIVYEGTPFSGEGTYRENQYISRRDPKAGWQTTTLSPLLVAAGSPQGYRAFDADLTRGVLGQLSPALSSDAPAGYPNLYSQPTDNPLALTPLLSQAPPNRLPDLSSQRLQLNYAGASADLSRIFFSANDALSGETPFAPEALDGGPTKTNLYEWAEGQLRLVNVLPGNASTSLGASFGKGGAHAVSNDGSRVFWEDEAHQVYLREGAEQTRAIETEGTPDPGAFLLASPQGTEVLLANGHLHGLGEEEPTTDLSQGKGGFQGIAGNSEDLSRIYFIDTAVLSGEEANGQGAKAIASKDNLYAWQEGSTRFIATLSSEDNGVGQGAWAASPSARLAEASPDGRWLTFLSKAQLTGYDNVGPCAFNSEGVIPGPCPEAFLYDSASGELACASCSRAAIAPLGASTLRLIQGAGPSFPQPRYLSDSGRLFFDSQDTLSSFDTNEGIEDVYEFEPQEVGGCGRPDGCVSLISAGTGSEDSNFLAADPSGKNVFFTSRDQLAQKDRDDLIDLYDAREEGGAAAESEPARAECQGEACQPLVSAPNDPTPGSSLIEGAGNVNEGKAKKHKHKKQKKHVKKHKKQKQAKKAKHERGGAK